MEKETPSGEGQRATSIPRTEHCESVKTRWKFENSGRLSVEEGIVTIF